MTMTLSGDGTITGLTAGGLPNGTIQPADLSTGAPTWDTSGNFQFNSGYGSVATAYGCRAWVNFNGTGTIAIRGSGNVSSITDFSVGRYGINFSTAMPDVNYAISAFARDSDNLGIGLSCTARLGVGWTSSQVAFDVLDYNISTDSSEVTASIFR